MAAISSAVLGRRLPELGPRLCNLSRRTAGGDADHERNQASDREHCHAERKQHPRVETMGRIDAAPHGVRAPATSGS